jgi:murein DD-endopeptidase MepM/ murein hydrolase activator NlpD
MRISALALLLLAQVVFAQPEGQIIPLPLPGHGDDRASIEQALIRARKMSEQLQAQRGPAIDASVPSPLMDWPVRAAIAVDAVTIQALSNYVDQNTGGGITDYNCGDRTYDTHRGTDIGIFPFPWQQMKNDEGIVIAAAAGTIVDKVNDQPERSCSIDEPAGDSNTIVIEQSDGSLALYAHMRKGSLTAKPVGATVEAGEYLGVVGSSGMSTGPHLHFEVGFWEQEGNNQVWRHRDPYAGTCNDLNAESWWDFQLPYTLSILADVATHDAVPEYPPCPGDESPHYQDRFSAGDTIFFTAAMRDQLKGQILDFTIRMPDGQEFLNWQTSENSVDHYPASLSIQGLNLPNNAQAGEWSFEVRYEGQTMAHSFWIDANPPNPTSPPVSNNRYNGLWFDAGLDGEGYNIVTAQAGTIIFYYGSDANGNRLWLISDLITEGFSVGVEASIRMYESTGGTYDKPIQSGRGLSFWGLLKLTFSGCGNAVGVLNGVDGNKVSTLIKLAAIPGTGCAGSKTSESELSGIWFDTALEGEGFNLIVTPNGVVLFYYGFDKDGNRVWLIAGPLEEQLTIGGEVTATWLKAPGGTYDAPLPSGQLVEWGTVKIKVNSCLSIDYTMETPDGNKLSGSVHLANVTGLGCS